MPKILRILNRFNLGGPTYNAALLSKHMAPEFETMLVGGEKDETEETSLFIVKNLGLEPVILSDMKRSVNPTSDLKAYYKLKSIIKEFKPDIVHTHAAKAGFIGRLAAHHCNVPVIVHTFHGHVFHSYFNSAKTGIYKNLERYAAGISSGIIAISDKQKHEIATIHKICAPDKIKVIPLGFDLMKFQENSSEKRRSFRATYGIEDNEIAIGIIGRLVPIKNHSLFLNALKIVLEKTTKNIRAFIIGDGQERSKLELLANNLNIEFTSGETKEKLPLTFTSWIKDIDWANAGMDIIALTSLNEGTPVSLIEAQAAAKPIVTTAVGGIEDVVIPQKTALLSPSGDYEGFAENLLNLIENDDLRKKMNILGPDFVNKKFQYPRLINDMKLYYHSLLKTVNSKESSM
ncbi:MAG: glycosyltransferase [Bacteroidetes bacterium]|nr:glycosyltransferase [Bacteroidota bacterium]HET6243608.1 glycosyltransferase [Bacteroidia bacterium]